MDRLTALLQATNRLRGGVLVTGMVYRHPGVLANMASTLDITSGGRLEFGIGAGWNEEECDAFGIHLGSMQERFDRFEEGLEVLERLLANERTTFSGSYYVSRGDEQSQASTAAIAGVHRREGKTAHVAARRSLRDHWNFGADMAAFAECRTCCTRRAQRWSRPKRDRV